MFILLVLGFSYCTFIYSFLFTISKIRACNTFCKLPTTTYFLFDIIILRFYYSENDRSNLNQRLGLVLTRFSVITDYVQKSVAGGRSFWNEPLSGFHCNYSGDSNNSSRLSFWYYGIKIKTRTLCWSFIDQVVSKTINVSRFFEIFREISYFLNMQRNFFFI